MGKPKGKRQLIRPRHRSEDGIKWILGKLVGGVWIGFTWLRIGSWWAVVNEAMNLQVVVPLS
jgi:hypothetical protein